jgi:hypothetical protein
MTDNATKPNRDKKSSPGGKWRQPDLRRALAAAEQAGLRDYRVELAPDGTISIIVGDPCETAKPGD